ncbi:MAG TPA: hypothetical protein VMV10_09575 [Pirellulales bacterium]|nr:hypothetical protein [Pirellulales bacterium]
MESAESMVGSRKPCLPLTALLICYALVDCLAPAAVSPIVAALHPSDYLPPSVAFFGGCLLSQFGAIATWGVLGPGRAIVRWTKSLLATALLSSALFAACTLFSQSEPDWQNFLNFQQCLSVAFLGLQTPVWTLSLGWGYRLCAPGSTTTTPQRFTLRGLFFAIGVVAATLAVQRVGAAGEPSSLGVAISIGIIGWTGSAWGLLAVLPCLLTAFLPAAPKRGVKFLAAYVSAISIAPVLAVLVSNEPDRFGFLLMYAAFCASVAFMLFGSFLLLRRHGYSLRRIK